jgi:N-acetylmuramoyl-L-alanine amidase
VAYSYKNKTKGAEYRDSIYSACVAAGGLVGNRAEPIQAYGFYVLKNTNAPAVLMEYGFMDSKVDVPVILSESYAKDMAYATMEGIAKAANLKKKTVVEEPVQRSIEIPMLKRGDKDAVVEAMQILLDLRGFECGDGGADGSFGPATERALIAFQKYVGLEGYGSCDLATWSALLGIK